MTSFRSACLAVAITTATLLAACGGGGGSAGTPNTALPSVVSASAGSVKYSQTLVVTVNGSNLDQGVGASSPGCANATLSTVAPYVSTATTAYIRCTASAVGTQQLTVLRTADNATLATVPFAVEVPQVTLAVSNGAGVAGSVVLTLTPQLTPITVMNFLNYVNAGFYAGTVFHRLATGFVIQGGGYAGPLVAGGTLPTTKTANAPITLEDNAGLSNLRWTVAMARTSAADSATSQFFINLADNTFLDRTATARGYAVFGSVTTGTDVVAAMAGAPCAAWPAFFGSGSTDCLPSPNLTITGAVQTR